MRAHALLLAGTFALASAAPAVAQPLPRADLTGVVGWFNAGKSDINTYDQWYHSAYGGAGIGWYWTEHLKTEVELGATASGELYGVQTIEIDGHQAYVSSRHRFSTRRITAGQQYQFLHNAWVHPHAAAGVDVIWETDHHEDDPIAIFDQASRTSRVVQPALTIGPVTDLRVRPFAELGAKLYLSRRAFVRTDLRLTFHDGVDEVLLRVGLGIDF